MNVCWPPPLGMVLAPDIKYIQRTDQIGDVNFKPILY